MMVVHKKVGLLKVDDTMAVLHTRAVAGRLGGILTGLFAEARLNRLFFGDSDKSIGLLYGFNTGRVGAGFGQIGLQLGGILFVIVLNVVITGLICLLIRLVMPLRLSDEELQDGDDGIHGEEAYALWDDGEKLVKSKHNSVNIGDDRNRSSNGRIELYGPRWIWICSLPINFL